MLVPAAGRGRWTARARNEPMESVSHDGQGWSNADQDRVELVDYDPRWPALFDAEASRIRAALSSILPFTLEHFGSTAIPGLAAKPIIDIMLITTDQAHWTRLIEPIQSLGYVFWAENPRQDRMFFVKGMPPFGERRTHHIHVRTPPDAETAVLFRDHLRRHPEDVVRYASLKRDLATRHPTDRDGYTEGKSQFVNEVVQKARSRWAVVRPNENREE
jgi:GrpB-like predicted nucleotidyltransferase (UPF0157 family)